MVREDLFLSLTLRKTSTLIQDSFFWPSQIGLSIELFWAAETRLSWFGITCFADSIAFHA